MNEDEVRKKQKIDPVTGISEEYYHDQYTGRFHDFVLHNDKNGFAQWNRELPVKTYTQWAREKELLRYVTDAGKSRIKSLDVIAIRISQMTDPKTIQRNQVLILFQKLPRLIKSGVMKESVTGAKKTLERLREFRRKKPNKSFRKPMP